MTLQEIMKYIKDLQTTDYSADPFSEQMFRTAFRKYVIEALNEHGLIPKPKKRVTKTIELWINVYPDGMGPPFHSKEIADNYANTKTRISCVRLQGSYEVEE